jgi:hypothetical protein
MGAKEELQAAVQSAVVDVVVGKKFYQSKTFWANMVAAVAFAAQAKFGFVVGPEIQAVGLSVLNIALRKVTNEPIVW